MSKATKKDTARRTDGLAGFEELDVGTGDDPFLDMLDEFSAQTDGELRVTRQENADGTENVRYLFTNRGMALSFTQLMDKLRDTYKGGTFLIEMRADNKWRRKMLVKVEPRPDAEGPGSTQLEKVLAEFRQMNIDSQKRIDALLAERQQQPPADPFLQLERMTTIIKNLMPAPAPAGGASELIAGVTGILDISDRVSKRVGGGGGESLLEKGMGLLAAQLAVNNQPAATAAGSPAAAAAAAEAAGATVVEGEATTVSSADHATSFLGTVSAMMPELIAAAESDDDPYFFASLLLRKLPPDITEQEVLGWLANEPMLIEGLATNFPAAKPHEAWFREVVGEMRQMLQESNKPE